MPRKKSTATVGQIVDFLNTIAPPHLAEEWDNVGLISGDPARSVRRVLLTIDVTPEVADEALAAKADLIVSYHPPIFKAQKKFLASGNTPSALAVKLAMNGIAIYSPHTALDVADGGTNDVLAETLGAKIVGSMNVVQGKGHYLKLVTFIPEADVEQVADALFAAGCGHIGTQSKYTKCSFRSSGTGTFQGDENSNPAVGQRNVYERQPEVRFETILPARIVGEVIAALKGHHPYEEPAFDLIPLQTPPETVGLGRIAELPRQTTLKKLAETCRKTLSLKTVQLGGDFDQPVTRVGLIAGSAGQLALSPGAQRQFDVLITGELKHHDMLAYQAAGIPFVCLGHGHSERPVLKVLAQKISATFSGIIVEQSKADRDPFIVV